ncbi:MAG: hypothetical protein K1X28_03745 [Parachlamydiales bacterium]|nr:hypothetical protein [Parachlamydiales bacterium]
MKKASLLILIALFAVLSSIWWIETNSLKKEISSQIDCDAISRKGFPFSPKIRCENLRSKDGKIQHEGWASIGVALLGNQAWVDLSGTITLDQKLAISGEMTLENIPFDDLENSLLKNLSFQARDFTISLEDSPALEAEKLSIQFSDNSKFSLDIQKSRLSSFFSQLFPENKTDVHLVGTWTLGEKLYPFSFELEHSSADCYSSGNGKAKVLINLSQDQFYDVSAQLTNEQTVHKEYTLPEKELFMSAAAPVLDQYPLIHKICNDHWDQLQTLIPSFLGKTNGELAIKLAFPSPETQISEPWKIIFDKLSVQNECYGFELKGAISNELKYAFDLSLKNYQPMIQNLAGYYNRWQKLLSAPDLLGPTLFPANEKMAAHLVSFLKQVSDQHTENDLTLSIQGSESVPFALGNQTPESLAQAVQKLTNDCLAEIELELKVDPASKDVLVSPGAG